jgi:hypothetical protein
MAQQAQAPRRQLQSEYVPLILLSTLRLLKRDQVAEAIELLDSLNVTNELFKEHLMDLCHNRAITEEFDKLTT